MVDQDTQSNTEPEPLSDDFYAQFTPKLDFPTWDLLRKAGVRINDDGRVKYIKAMFKRAVIETMQAWRDGWIAKEEMQAYIEGLGNGKMTRYKLESELVRLKRAGVKASERLAESEEADRTSE